MRAGLFYRVPLAPKASPVAFLSEPAVLSEGLLQDNVVVIIILGLGILWLGTASKGEANRKRAIWKNAGANIIIYFYLDLGVYVFVWQCVESYRAYCVALLVECVLNGSLIVWA